MPCSSYLDLTAVNGTIGSIVELIVGGGLSEMRMASLEMNSLFLVYLALGLMAVVGFFGATFFFRLHLQDLLHTQAQQQTGIPRMMHIGITIMRVKLFLAP